jgi:hypothetical protein
MSIRGSSAIAWLLAIAALAAGTVLAVRWRAKPKLTNSELLNWTAKSTKPYRGRLSGIVLDERAQPAPDITVQAANSDRPSVGMLPWTQTDAKGRFALAGPFPGHVHVNAFNEKAFYPNASSNLWDGQGVAEVELPVGGEVSDIVLKLSPVGRLQVKAKNAVTGAVIDSLGVSLERDGAPNRGTGGGTWDDSWLVPTVPIRFCVTKEGFQAAWYGGDGSFEKSLPITVAPRRVFTAMVPLWPLNSAAANSTCSSRRSR